MRRRSLLLPIILIVVGGVGLVVTGVVTGPMMGAGPAGFAPGWGAWADAPPRAGTPLSLDQAAGRVREYLAARGDPDLEPAEVMEFSNHFYASVREKSTGRYAFELLIDRYSGALVPEPGPNMMWNLKYGMMGFRGWRGGEPGAGGTMPVTAEEARDRALRVLRSGRGGDTVGKPEAFYGYYTFDILSGGKVAGMLSVNGYSGDVWIHRWHGRYEGGT